MFCNTTSVAGFVVHYRGAPCIFRGLLHTFPCKYLHVNETWFCSGMLVDTKTLAAWKCAMQWLESVFYCYGDVTSVLLMNFFFSQLKELTVMMSRGWSQASFTLSFPMGAYVAIEIILCNIRAACTAEGGWEKMASFVIIYSVLYLPICTLADNAPA